MLKNVLKTLVFFRHLPPFAQRMLRGLYSPVRTCTHKRTQRRLKKDVLELLGYLNESNIPYWADGGSLLGALRHRGIIPWDTDFDICIFAEDAMTLFEMVSKKPSWQVQSCRKQAYIRNFSPAECGDEMAFFLFKDGKPVADVNFCFIDKEHIPEFWKAYAAGHPQEHKNGFARYRFPVARAFDNEKFAFPASFLEEFCYTEFYDTKIRIFKRSREWLEITYGKDVMTRMNSPQSRFDSSGKTIRNFSPA